MFHTRIDKSHTKSPLPQKTSSTLTLSPPLCLCIFRWPWQRQRHTKSEDCRALRLPVHVRGRAAEKEDDPQRHQQQKVEPDRENHHQRRAGAAGSKGNKQSDECSVCPVTCGSLSPHVCNRGLISSSRITSSLERRIFLISILLGQIRTLPRRKHLVIWAHEITPGALIPPFVGVPFKSTYFICS